MDIDWDETAVDKLISEVFKRSSDECLSENDRAFLRRVLLTPQSVYQDRVAAVGLSGLARVLDAGCGFGQWSASLARLNRTVDAVDVSGARVSVARGLCGALGIANAAFHEASIESLPFNDETFDGIFSYSVVYLTDWRKSLAEFARCLKPDGLLYVNTNGLGWYLLNFVEDRQSVEGYSSKVMARDALANTIRYYSENKREEGHCIVMPSDIVVSHLSRIGLQIVAKGPDGDIALNEGNRPKSFFEADAFGVESVWEVVCRKVANVDSLI
jgi:SAM-dependent methyltransferase